METILPEQRSSVYRHMRKFRADGTGCNEFEIGKNFPPKGCGRLRNRVMIAGSGDEECGYRDRNRTRRNMKVSNIRLGAAPSSTQRSRLEDQMTADRIN